jgi:hypothetical protein
MNEPETSAETPGAVYVPYPEFCAGLPAGRFRLIVNPERAQKYVKRRLFVVGVSLPILGIGVALSLSGYPWIGLPLVVIGGLMHRVIKAHATKILLHLALHDDKTYHEALEFEIMEVRYAA